MIIMMRFSVVLLLMINFLVSAQLNKAILKISYETKLIPDSTSNDKSPIIMDYILLCNNSQSIYFNDKAKNYYTSLFGNNHNSGEIIATNRGNIPKTPKVKGSVYKLDELILVYLPIGNFIFQYEEPSLKWEILQDTKNMKGYSCRLAKTTIENNDVFYAWFTNDIPIPEGPFRFKGLSGLVLEVYNPSKTIEINAIEIKKSEEIIEPITYGETLIKTKSKSQYLEARKNYTENPSIYNGGLIIFDSNGNERKLPKSTRNVFLD